ncbi:hypothetical protein [Congregibacter litoralis]|uniref:Uncharacterized protein n=1 Tax=Congregibacter litoralis KT71 TaxID=314285 RepID=A4ABD5_9GAMM|nr:hypothetical protein [Congregibacter litoralis]EAQ96689.1 hypothetical protein KT71_06689 [Congregibacter litoralis KT71]
MEWLRHTRNIIDLAQEGEALSTLGAFAQQHLDTLGAIDARFPAISAALDDALSEEDAIFATAVNATDLVALYAIQDSTNDAQSALSTILEEAGVKASQFQRIVAIAREALSHVPDDYRKLLRHVDAFSEQIPGKNPGLVTLDLSQSMESDSPLTHGMALEMGASGVAALELEAGHLVAEDERLLRIGVHGTLDANLSASAPLGAATLGVSSEAEGRIRADYLFKTATERGVFALEAANALPQLVNPLSLDDLFSAMKSSQLDSISLQLQGRTSLATNVGVSRRLDIAKLATVTGGVSIEADVWMGGSYTLDVIALDEGIRAELSTTRAKGQGAGLEVGVTLNASQMAERVKAELAQPLAALKHNLDEIDQFLQPGTALKQHIRTKLDNEFASDEPTLLIANLALGFTNAKQTKNKLTAILSGYLDSQTSAWQEDLNGAVTAGIRWATTRNPGLQQPAITDKLKRALKEAIKQGGADLQSRVDEIAQDSQRLDRLLEGLAEVGVNVSSTADRADTALSGVKKGLQNYRKLVADLLHKAEEVATADLQFQLSHSVVVSSGSTVDASATITRVNNGTRAAYAALVSGQLERILKLDDSTVAGVSLTLGSWQRFAHYQENQGISVVVLDFDLKDTTVFSSNARVQVDSDGAISVLAEADWVKRRSFFKESREFHFSGIYSLSTARFSRSYRGAIDITYQDKHGRERDIQAFYERLIDANLISPLTAENAKTRLSHASHRAGGANVAMEISATLELTSAELERLIGVSSANRLSKRSCAEHTLRSLLASGAMSEETFALGVDGLRRTPRFNRDGTPEELLQSLTIQRIREAQRNFSNHGAADTRDALKEWIKAKKKSDSLFDMLRGMAAVYQANPEDLKKKNLEKWYRKKQEPIGDGLREWVTFDGVLIDPIRPELSEQTLALLMIIADLSDPHRVGSFPLQGYIRLAGEEITSAV